MEMGASSSTRLTREELYERVWTEPMATLAPRLGLSDVGLKKTCLRMRVPTPPRGYWAKRAAGQKVKRAPLPKLPASVTAEMLAVTFGQPPRPTPEQHEEPWPVGDQCRHEALPAHRITVVVPPTDPHPLVAASVHLLRNAKADAEHRLAPRGKKCLALRVTLATVDRALCIYDALLEALERRGYPVTVIDDAESAATIVRIGQDPVSIAIEERIDRVAAPPPASPPRGALPRPVTPYEHVPTGRLTLRIQHSYVDVRRSWSDGAR